MKNSLSLSMGGLTLANDSAYTQKDVMSWNGCHFSLVIPFAVYSISQYVTHFCFVGYWAVMLLSLISLCILSLLVVECEQWDHSPWIWNISICDPFKNSFHSVQFKNCGAAPQVHIWKLISCLWYSLQVWNTQDAFEPESWFEAIHALVCLPTRVPRLL